MARLPRSRSMSPHIDPQQLAPPGPGDCGEGDQGRHIRVVLLGLNDHRLHLGGGRRRLGRLTDLGWGGLVGRVEWQPALLDPPSAGRRDEGVHPADRGGGEGRLPDAQRHIEIIEGRAVDLPQWAVAQGRLDCLLDDPPVPRSVVADRSLRTVVTFNQRSRNSPKSSPGPVWSTRPTSSTRLRNAVPRTAAVPVTVRETYFGLFVTGERPASTRSSQTVNCPLPRTLRCDPCTPRTLTDMGSIWDACSVLPPSDLVRPSGFEPETCGLRVRCSAVELEAHRRV